MSVARVLACSVDAVPCPAEAQSWVSVADAIDPAALGVTPADVAYVFSWGVGAVLALWAIGYAVGAATRALDKA